MTNNLVVRSHYARQWLFAGKFYYPLGTTGILLFNNDNSAAQNEQTKELLLLSQHHAHHAIPILVHPPAVSPVNSR